jgi:hypothetical protein
MASAIGDLQKLPKQMNATDIFGFSIVIFVLTFPSQFSIAYQKSQGFN